jgi:hypothetical protein
MIGGKRLGLAMTISGDLEHSLPYYRVVTLWRTQRACSHSCNREIRCDKKPPELA